ncbi:MAG: TIGR04282 family arsenosugar biosynthesis glycosyltransferase [Flavobacteriales bacterium]|nr:TIGR04282 family arsenosugar biosynthesis glycosyltransferase [Flavobacteriales bacterium]|tara:strand:+ start:268 stop:870 length:603 start_codon:yes stop_codon:yes gene_type:complete
MSINHLIIFVKNPELGKVKTRLAKTIGDEKALYIYKLLLEQTFQVTLPVMAEKKLYYSEFVQNMDQFNDLVYEKHIQSGDGLGNKMYHAIKHSFAEWADKVVLIGSDCFELNSGIIEEAFKALEESDYVLGPAKDGGYYLIGMKELNLEVFQNKEWSTENVFLDTLLDIKNQGKSHYILPTLSDVDVEEDLGDLRGYIEE